MTPFVTPNERGSAVKDTAIAVFVFTNVIVGLRFWSRALISEGRKFWWDDWLALAVLPMILGQMVVNVLWVYNGLGQHIDQVPLANFEEGLHNFYAGYFFFDAGITLPRLSAVFFYVRVFGYQTQALWFRMSLWVASLLCCAWLIAILFSGAFQCSPIARAWDLGLTGTCFKTSTWFMVHAITNMVLDVAVLVLPMPLVWKLQMRSEKKALLTVVFLCGYGSAVVSLARGVETIVYRESFNKDLPYSFVTVFYLVQIEPVVATTCVCLPAIFHLFRRAAQHGLGALFTTKNPYTEQSTRRSKTTTRHSFMELHGELDSFGLRRTRSKGDPFGHGPTFETNTYQASAAALSGAKQSEENIELANEVHVRKDISVDAHEGWSNV